MVNRALRLWRHGLQALMPARGLLTESAHDGIEGEIAAAESSHEGEIVFAIEAALSCWQLWRGLGSRARAEQVFSALGVWDTAHNNGVLIYVLLADRSVEILADRAVAARIGDATWQRICREFEAACKGGEPVDGARAAVRAVAAQLARHWPVAGGDRNELPNQPVLL